MAALVLAVTLAPAARAEGPPEGEFNNGAGDSHAEIMSAKALAGSTEIGIDFGVALAKYQGNVGIAEGRAFDLGILEALLATSCDGSPPSIDPNTITHGTRVDSRDADPLRLAPTQVLGFGDRPKGVGTQWSGATNAPWAHAGTEILPLNFGMSVEGGRNTVTTEVKDQVRSAVSTVTADRIVYMGILSLEQPKWESVVRTGAVEERTGSFTFRKARLFGKELDPKTAEREIRKGLADWSRSTSEVGLRFDYPEVVVEGDRVEVTPLAIRIVDSPAGKKGVGPALEAIQPLREILFEYLLELDCNFATTITILDVLLGVLSGAGGIHITAGGVTSEVDDSWFENPFGAQFGSVALGSAPATVAVPPPQTTAPPPAPASQAAQATETAAPAFDPASSEEQMPGSTDPVAAAAAGILLALVAGLAAGDFFWMRRTNRRIPDT